jgi:hypothetical protein
VLLGLSILGQSRGWLFALIPMLVLALVVVPGRGRTIAALALVGAVTATVLGSLVDVYDAFKPLKPLGATWDQAVRMLFGAALGVGLIGAGVALYEDTLRIGAARARRISAGLVAVVVAAAVLAVAGYAVAKQDPVGAVADKWKEFKKGGSEPSFNHSRFTTKLNSYRYDYWNVAWHEFERHPIAGVGVDNFQLDYLRDGKSHQTPAYPHSTPLRALSETGLVGGVLFLALLAGAVAAALPALRGPPLSRAAAGAGLAMCGYWLLHGSLDWLWEFPALSGAALMGLALAAAVAARERPAPAPGAPLLSRRPLAAVTAVAAVALLAGIGLPLVAARDLSAAKGMAATNPRLALDRLDRSGRLNPLSALPQRTAGVIRVREGDLKGAAVEFRASLARGRRDAFSTLMLAAIASNEGRQAAARRLIADAHRMAPRWYVLEAQELKLKRGRRLDPSRLERALNADIRERIGPE